MEPGSERLLDNPPQDGISSLAFSPSSSNLLLVSSWDKTARLYDTSSNVAKGVWQNHAAVLDCTVQDDHTGFSGGLDRAVRKIYLNQPEDPGLNIGSHAREVSCMEFSRELGALVTGGWDGHVHIWDPRSQGRAQSLPPSEKVFTLAVSGQRLVVGTSDRSVLIYDVRKLSAPDDRRESSLKHQTRCIRIAPDHSGYVLASVEGRVAVEYFDLSAEVQAQRYAFKCHRQDDLVYPVNAVAFHPTHGTFATGGCDAMVYTWDGQNKKRLAHLGPYKTSIAALSYNFDGSLMAIAASYTYEEGEKEHPPDAVYLRCPLEGEVKRKVKTGG
ncbi:hypothetical protein NSK_003565 [Nannochloropsis salina CCMP1776]|uniref:Uncharacterized protein n=1 Tax=Nannochloropsis salina CCMP1776 TaxID=1027361 RepID=A0A4D9D0K5_9STRA|nr:hypothetical protein NSK_003565 [Nannochloropsis salina CCMP1776]|eukprot:TFJ85142.1 hypothetical protein NSK_003565 [Nannochloropsis salina CCMP1776]